MIIWTSKFMILTGHWVDKKYFPKWTTRDTEDPRLAVRVDDDTACDSMLRWMGRINSASCRGPKLESKSSFNEHDWHWTEWMSSRVIWIGGTVSDSLSSYIVIQSVELARRLKFIEGPYFCCGATNGEEEDTLLRGIHQDNKQANK